MICCGPAILHYSPCRSCCSQTITTTTVRRASSHLVTSDTELIFTPQFAQLKGRAERISTKLINNLGPKLVALFSIKEPMQIDAKRRPISLCLRPKAASTTTRRYRTWPSLKCVNRVHNVGNREGDPKPIFGFPAEPASSPSLAGFRESVPTTSE